MLLSRGRFRAGDSTSSSAPTADDDEVVVVDVVVVVVVDVVVVDVDPAVPFFPPFTFFLPLVPHLPQLQLSLRPPPPPQSE